MILRSIHACRPISPSRANHGGSCRGVWVALVWLLSGLAPAGVWASTGAWPGVAYAAGSASSEPSEQTCGPFSWVGLELAFTYDNGARGAKHLPETMGAGVAVLDSDLDGDQDLLFVQSGELWPAERPVASHAGVLFLNQGNGQDWQENSASFASVSSGYGQGALVFDADGDHDLDVWLTRFGRSSLLVNDGQGVFDEQPISGDPGGWGSSAAAADFDGDGDLEVYESQYVPYSNDLPFFCGDAQAGVKEYCDPSLFQGLQDRFFENVGSSEVGSLFRDATQEMALGGTTGKGLGVIFSDLDGDRWPDLYVANDLTPNFLFLNGKQGLPFEDQSMFSGAAVDRNGRPEAGMGVAFGDVDGDQDPDLVVTNFDVETNTLYKNQGQGLFQDVSAQSGFGLPSFNRLGFGVVLEDFDLDGILDALVANGHIFEDPERDTVTYRQPELLLHGTGGGQFKEVACAELAPAVDVSRGLAVVDVDNDGDRDLALSNNVGPARLWINQVDPDPEDWVGVELVSRGGNTQAIGARVQLVLRGRSREGQGASNQSQGLVLATHWIHAGRSYQSSSDRRIVFGLRGSQFMGAVSKESGDATEALEIHIDWPPRAGERAAPVRSVIRGFSRGVYLRLVEPGA